MVLVQLFAGHQWSHRHRKQTYGYEGGGSEQGEGGIHRESNMETYGNI